MSSTIPEITLCRGFPGLGTYVWTPYAMKIEFRLRHSQVPYNINPAGGMPKEGPKGKIPFVDVKFHKAEVERLGDSSLIIRRFVKEGVLQDLNGGLKKTEKLADMSIRALCEDKMYFYQVCP